MTLNRLSVWRATLFGFFIMAAATGPTFAQSTVAITNYRGVWTQGNKYGVGAVVAKAAAPQACNSIDAINNRASS